MTDALSAALAIAAEGRAVFPCRADKRPATPHGFKDASRDPEAIRDLWRRWPGDLIGVATGEVSDLAVLDIDAKPDGRAWWARHRARLPVTRTIRTRSGGLHLYFRHLLGLRCSASVIASAIDVRADGGYVIAWHSAGLPVLQDALLAPWPEWLLEQSRPLTSPPLRPITMPASSDGARRYALGAVRRAVERVAAASEGTRNDRLNEECFALARFVCEGAIGAREMADALATAAVHAGLTARETAATLASALRAGGAA